MRRLLFIAGIAVSLAVPVLAQTSGSTKAAAGGSSHTMARKDGSTMSIESGTQIAAQLQNSLNVKKAKVGDQVVLKTTHSIKQNGEVVIEKGSKLIGRVTDVSTKAEGTAESSVSILFDSLRQDDMTMPITASIVSVTRAAVNAHVMDDNMGASSSGSSSMSRSGSTQTRSSGGGLLGGVTNTVGGVANTTVSTVGGVANTATNTVGGVANTVGNTAGSSAGTVGTTIRGLSVSSSSSASANGSSTLTMSGDNLKLDKGTMFNLSVSGSANSSTTATTGN